MAGEHNLLRCALSAVRPRTRKKLVAGPTVYICKRVWLLQHILKEEDKGEPKFRQAEAGP